MSQIMNENNQTIIKPESDVVASMAEEFKNELISAIDSSSDEFVIDLDNAKMVDSVGIGVIIAAHNTLNQSGRMLKIINVSQDIYNLFSAMRLNRRFPIEAK